MLFNMKAAGNRSFDFKEVIEAKRNSEKILKANLTAAVLIKDCLSA